MRILGLVYMFVGLLNLMFGYRLFRIILGIYGFIAGAALGAVLGGSISGGENTGMILGALILGAIGAGLAVIFYYFGIFLLGAFLGVLVAGLLFSGEVQPVILGVFGAIGGILAVVIQKFIIIVATSFSGSWGTLVGLAILVGWADPGILTDLVDTGFHIIMPNVHPAVFIALWIVLGVFGILFQYGVFGGKRPQPVKAAPPEHEDEE